jgi:hypothetical protein
VNPPRTGATPTPQGDVSFNGRRGSALKRQVVSEKEWTPLDQKRPSAQVTVGLVCVDFNGNVAHALGWLDLNDEWVITAIPTHEAPLKEISHWCELPTSLPGYHKGDPWPEIRK